MNRPTDERYPRHPIQVVVRRTGLSADVLRAWERRYGAVQPERSETGRRLYSDADVERLVALRRAANGGRSISQVAQLPMERLEALIAEDRSSTVEAVKTAEPVERPSPSTAAASSGAGLIGRALAAIERLDGPALDSALQGASLEYSRPALIETVIVPLMLEVGDRWRAGTLRIAHEHLASAAVRSFLGELVSAAGGRSRDVLVVSTPSGHRHELGAMLAAATAMGEGWDVVYLGPDLPAEEIAAAAVQAGARAIALSLIYPSADASTASELKRLVRLVPSHVGLFAGGRAAHSYDAVLDGVNVQRPPDLARFRIALEGLAAHPSTPDREQA